MSILKWLVHLSLVVQFLATKVIHVFSSQTCFCLCRIINLNIVKKYQIIDHVFYFFHQIIEEVPGITLVLLIILEIRITTITKKKNKRFELEEFT